MSRTATDTKTMKARVSAARLVARAVLTIVWAAVLVAAISVLLPAFNVPAPSVLGRVYDLLTSLLAASPALAVAGGVLSLLLLIALTAIAFRTPRPALKAGVHKSDVALAAPPVAVIPAQPLVAPAPAVTLVSLPTPPSEPEPAHPPVPPVRSRKVFISHSHADNDACDRYYEALTQRGYDVWYDRRSMPPGAQLSEDIQREMRNRSAFLLMLSTASVASEWVKAETDAYRTLVFNERFRLLLPIRLEPCDAPLLLEGLKALNAYTMTFDAAIDQIVWALEAPPAANAPDTTLAAAAVPPGVVAPAGFPRALAFVGRQDETSKLVVALKAGTSSGVYALEGMGGVGKTALAAEVVTQLADDRASFPGGAVWISCEGVADAEGLAELWARVARGLRLEQVATLADPAARRAALAEALLRRDRTLIALDNVEPGLDAEAALDTLAVPGHTAVLITSRNQIAPSRLKAIVLPPLPAPDAEKLFVQRLRQADESRPTAEERPHIARIVESVGGLPLAIEQLASYAGNQRLTLSTLLDQLARSGINAAAFKADAKRVLTKVFERSVLAVAPRQQVLFAGLSLLAGPSFPRDATLAIARSAADGDAEADPEADVGALVAYALVEPLPGERLRLHPLLREYAELRLSQLPADVSDRLGDAMVAYWLAYAQAHPGYEGMDALEAEAAGLMGALEWAHEHGRYRDVLALGRALNDGWETRGRRDELKRIIPWERSAAEALGDLKEQFWAIHQAAMLDGRTGQVERSRDEYRQALELARQLDDPKSELMAVHGLAIRDAGQGKLAEARAGFERALALARRLGDPRAEQAELQGLADTIRYLGETEKARDLLNQALKISERLGNPLEIGINHLFLGRLDRQESRAQDAIAHYREALRLFEQLQSPNADEAREALRRLGAEP